MVLFKLFLAKKYLTKGDSKMNFKKDEISFEQINQYGEWLSRDDFDILILFLKNKDMAQHMTTTMPYLPKAVNSLLSALEENNAATIYNAVDILKKALRNEIKPIAAYVECVCD